MKRDHATIRTRDFGATRDFIVSVVGGTPGNRPASIRRIPGCWPYSDGRPLVHVIGSDGVGADGVPEAIDHVGIQMECDSAPRTKLDHPAVPTARWTWLITKSADCTFRAPGGPPLEVAFSEPVPTETAGAAR